MTNFNLHSLANFSRDEINSWIAEGMQKVSQKMGIDVIVLEEMIKNQSAVIAERAKHQTIDINTLERQILRQNIIADYFHEFEDAKKERTAIVVLGQIASGKTSFCKSLLENDHAFVVDSDFIKQGYGNMAGLSAEFDNGRGTDQIHEEASMLAKQVLAQAASEGYNLVIPKTGIEYSSIEKILTNLKQNGYYVGLAYVDLPIKKCVERNFYRYIDEMLNGTPCRLIPFKTIEMIDDKPFKTFSKFLIERDRGLVDDFVALSNDVAHGEQMKQISLDEVLEFAHQNSKKAE